MKKTSMFYRWVFLFSLTLSISVANAQNSRERRLINDSKQARLHLTKNDRQMQHMFNNSYGYAVFPNVGKGAIGLGGAAGSGIVYEKGKMIGTVKMRQLSVGLQLGGQAYREVIFFEDKAALNRFKNDVLEFSAQNSVVAMNAGNSMNARYREGVMVFTQHKNGLMYDASVGGQRFNYDSF